MNTVLNILLSSRTRIVLSIIKRQSIRANRYFDFIAIKFVLAREVNFDFGHVSRRAIRLPECYIHSFQCKCKVAKSPLCFVERNTRGIHLRRLATSNVRTSDVSALPLRQMVESWCELLSLFQLQPSLLQTNFSYHTYFQCQPRFVRSSGMTSESSLSAEFLRC